MESIVLLNEAGPLPLTVQFEAPGDGPATFVLSGTAWTQDAPCLTAIELLLDGQSVGSSAMCFANQSANHQALRTTYIPIDNLSYGSHTFEVAAFNPQTVTDQNDYFQVVLFY